jgi:hypothetical protein
MRWLTYDLESTFLKRGFKRTDTMIIEIALHGKNDNESYQQLVNPLNIYSNGLEVIESLDNAGQNPQKSISFWVKLLSQKKLLNTSVRRKSMADQAQILSDLLNTSSDFVTTEKALQDAYTFGKNHKWIAHNGKAFDSKILLGNASKLDLTEHYKSVDFCDSLPMFKHYYKDEPSYSQPILYKSIFPGKKYFAHHALEDSKALHKMISITSETFNKDVYSLFDDVSVKKKAKKKLPRYKGVESDLIDIKGVGVKSVEVFIENGINNKKELNDYIDSHTEDDWKKTFNKIHAYKKLWLRLCEGEIKLL